MKRNHPKLRSGVRLLALSALPLAVGQALAAEYWLQTGTTTVQGVPMWGYQACSDGTFATCGLVTVPGPVLTVSPGDSGLTVHLKNLLSHPTSLVIAGQAVSNPTPVWTDGSSGPRYANPASPTDAEKAKRVRSFTAETAPGATADYVWPAVKPGSYLYQSGTEQQVQVQMGLYGAMTKDADAGNVAYRQGPTSVAYANQVTLVYSEVDPVLHQAVVDGSYGTTGPSSTLDYRPKFFLINGVPYPAAGLAPIATVAAAQPTLLRFLNAGLKTHVPSINGQYWKMIAEDGNPYPYLSNARQQYTAFLTAGKTLDVLLTPTNPNASGNVRYAIFDSRAYDTNNGAQGGGLLAYLDVTPATAAAPVFDSAPVTSGTVGVAYSYAAHATDPNGDAVTYSLNAGSPAGMSINGATGLVSWLPAATGNYPVSLRASDGTLFNDQAYAIAVAPGAPANNPPTARNDGYTAIAHPTGSGINQLVTAPGVLANDTDPDGNALHAGNKTGSALVTLSANGGFTLAPVATPGTVNFTYQALDTSNAASAAATVIITVVANRSPTAMADAFTVSRCTFRQGTSGTTCRTGTGFYTTPTLNLVNNDTDLDTATIDVANQTPLAVARVRSQTAGSNGGSTSAVTTSIGGRVTISAGSITYVPPYNFAGTDVFQYRVKDKLGKESGSTTTNSNNLGQGWATVTITVQ